MKLCEVTGRFAASPLGVSCVGMLPSAGLPGGGRVSPPPTPPPLTSERIAADHVQSCCNYFSRAAARRELYMPAAGLFGHKIYGCKRG